MPVNQMTDDEIGSGLIGIWRLEPKVSSVKPETIKIEYKDGAFYMEVLPKISIFRSPYLSHLKSGSEH